MNVLIVTEMWYNTHSPERPTPGYYGLGTIRELPYISILQPYLYNFFQWLFQPIQGPGLLFSSVIIFHRRYESLGVWSARRKAAT
jgi:hypothetical protein